MKKYFIAIAVAALALSACSKVEIKDSTPDQKITFQAANYVPQTKAGEVSFLNEFANASDAKFYSKAYMVGEGVSGTQDFFGEKETITWNANAKEWAPSHDYYWPKSTKSYVNFFSWYDSSTTAGPTVGNGTMSWTNRTIGTGDNIMYADPAWHFQKNTNPATYGKDEVKEGVPTLFHHALAQVVFNAYATKVESDVATWAIKLTDITIGKIYNQGTLSLTSTEPAATSFNVKGSWQANPAWTTTGTSANLAPADYTVTATSAPFLANQSVLPQTLTGVKLSFKLDITTTYKNGGQTNHEIIEKEIALTEFGPTAWALNTKYIYTLKIVPSENRVLFDPAVETAWTTVTTTEKDVDTIPAPSGN